MLDFNNPLRAYRDDRRLSLKDLADVINVSRSVMGGYRGRSADDHAGAARRTCSEAQGGARKARLPDASGRCV